MTKIGRLSKSKELSDIIKVEILSLLVTSFLRHLMQKVTQYSKIWRYDYNQSKSGVVVLWCLENHEYNIIKLKIARHWELDGNVVMNSMSTKM